MVTLKRFEVARVILHAQKEIKEPSGGWSATPELAGFRAFTGFVAKGPGSSKTLIAISLDQTDSVLDYGKPRGTFCFSTWSFSLFSFKLLLTCCFSFSFF